MRFYQRWTQTKDVDAAAGKIFLWLEKVRQTTDECERRGLVTMPSEKANRHLPAPKCSDRQSRCHLRISRCDRCGLTGESLHVGEQVIHSLIEILIAVTGQNQSTCSVNAQSVK